MLATQQQPNPHPHDHANESEGLDLLGTTTDSYGAAPVPVQTAVRPVPQDDTTTQPTSPEKLTVAIIGGGMGGLAAAVALGRAGVKVDLFEQAAEFAEIGAGIHLGPNTVRTLNQMGLGEAYDSVAETDDMGGLHFEWWNGMEDRKYGETFCKYPRSAVHRARLLEVFFKSLPPSVTVHFGARLLDVQNHPDGKGATVIWMPSKDFFADPSIDPKSTTDERFRAFKADVVVGADGVKSAVRAALELPSPPEAGIRENQMAKERYTGTYCYRGLIPIKDALEVSERFAIPRMWFGKGKHILIFPIEQGTILNIVAFVSDRSLPKDERSWTGPWVQPATLDQALHDFSDWHAQPRELLKKISPSGLSRWALHEVLVPPTWKKGRITLLGDACHGSLPHLGSGASMAIEDAFVLSALLGSEECTKDNVEAFLSAYEEVRGPRTRRQMMDAHETGEIFEYHHTGYENDMEMIVKDLPARHDWIWDYDVTDGVKEAVEILRKKGVVV